MSQNDKDYIELRLGLSEGAALRERYWQDVLRQVRRRRRSYQDEDANEIGRALGIPAEQVQRALKQLQQAEPSTPQTIPEAVSSCGR